MKILQALLFLLGMSIISQAQSVSGVIQDGTDNSPLIGVSVVLISAGDTTQKFGGITDIDGSFAISGMPAGAYTFRSSYVGFDVYSRTVNVTDSTSLGTIKMVAGRTTLESVQVTAQAIAAQQSGDTSSFNANAYKTNPDATAEDLITKMPGISTEGGTVKAQGEDVKQILVDGKPFFGDDPNAAIKNLPAEIIDRIQVFDKMSDQSSLTGFDDGQSQKTINIITKPGKNNGQFGKLYGGYGNRDEKLKDNLYQAGGNVNFFKGDTRLSIIALSNNINQQNFSTDDLMGVVNTSSGQSSGGSRGGSGGSGGFRGGGNRGSGDGASDNGRSSGGSDPSSFLVGQQSGITKTNSVGLNYSDEWGKKIRVSGSYFFNTTDNSNTTSLNRNYFNTGSDSSLIYKEESRTNTKNTNHRANLRLEYTIDSFNTLILAPRISFQNNEYSRDLMGRSRLTDSSLVSLTNNRNTSSNTGYSFGNNLTYQHKFGKRGRTASVNFNTQLNDRNGDGTLYSLSEYIGQDTTLLDQHYNVASNGYTLSGNVTYTEPLSQKSQLMVNYAPSYTSNKSDKETMNNTGVGEYTDLDTSLSNKFDNTYITQRGGLSYRYNDQKWMANVGVNYQRADLDGQQEFPRAFTIDKSFSNVLPSAMLNYKFTRTKNLRLMYRTSTNPPSISQLQNVLDNSNPLLLRAGNPDLKQNYTHTLMLRYGATNTGKSTNFFAGLFGSVVQNYVANATYIATEAPLVVDGNLLNPGTQLNRPVNLDGYYSLRGFGTYGFPLKPIKSNLNINVGANVNRLPALINNLTNYANNYTLNGGFVLSSNVNQNLDFTVSYTGNYAVVRNSVQTNSDNNYYYQTTAARLNWIFLNGFVFNTSLNHTLYTGLSEGYNQSFLLWNASFGYKFFKDKSLDIRLTAYDLLNQNRAIDRTVTETYIEDSYTNVLQRYFMLNATYTLRRFGGANASGKTPQDIMPPPGGPGGMGGLPPGRD